MNLSTLSIINTNFDLSIGPALLKCQLFGNSVDCKDVRLDYTVAKRSE